MISAPLMCNHCSVRHPAVGMSENGYPLCQGCMNHHLSDIEHRKRKSALDGQVAGEHYRTMVIQPAQFIHANALGFLEGCVIKRVCRFRDKAGREDLEKAIHELQLLIELEYGG